LGPSAPRADGLIAAARRRRLALKIVDVPSHAVRELYEAPLALVRPDQIVAWRGVGDTRGDTVIATIMGHARPQAPAHV
jgi:hypothetical protein